jgi:hypothetical protein
LRKHRASVASATTTDDLVRAVERLPDGTVPDQRVTLEGFRDALATLTRAQYTQAPIDDGAVEEAVRSATTAGQQVRREHSWYRTFVRSMRNR